MTPIRTLIVDDEVLARLNLATLLAEQPDVEIVGECADAPSAAAAIQAMQPQLVFLDVQLPGQDGFAVLEAMPRVAPPAVVFVTAHAEFALQAFEAQAIDYLLKPFRRERFADTLDRARTRLAGAPAPAASAAPGPGRSAPDRMVVKCGQRLLVIPFAEIDYLRAAANYVCIHRASEVHEVRERICVLAQTLPRASFLRIHRSYIVNLNQVRAYFPVGGGEYMVALSNGRELPVGASYTDAIRTAFQAAQMPRYGGPGLL